MYFSIPYLVATFSASLVLLLGNYHWVLIKKKKKDTPIAAPTLVSLVAGTLAVASCTSYSSSAFTSKMMLIGYVIQRFRLEVGKMDVCDFRIKTSTIQLLLEGYLVLH